MITIAYILLSLGAVLIFIASVGILRMPDVYMRASAVTKASVLGVGLMLVGAIFYFQSFGVGMRALAILFFVVATGPVGAHMIARAAYVSGEKLWSKTTHDDLKEKYDNDTHELSSNKHDDEENTL
ncbi:MAG: monovalent cation/H(+) antiporter subunit G [Bacteroidia bacterium]